ncbi:hypothetical protein [Burkholderia ubonensis]|uniref:hypothetical protein n=1 Tax=Burkholderia ubonensis TaxID=101571 RepID=UPI000B321FB3|nr:hypothetical protein [Burkholderia ubonensis]
MRLHNLGPLEGEKPGEPHRARSAIPTAPRRVDRLSRWIVQLQARVGYYKTLVTAANKHARILWVVLAKGEKFDPSHVYIAPHAAIGITNT